MFHKCENCGEVFDAPVLLVAFCSQACDEEYYQTVTLPNQAEGQAATEKERPF